jgi:hypothetical protein
MYFSEIYKDIFKEDRSHYMAMLNCVYRMLRHVKIMTVRNQAGGKIDLLFHDRDTQVVVQYILMCRP